MSHEQTVGRDPKTAFSGFSLCLREDFLENVRSLCKLEPVREDHLSQAGGVCVGSTWGTFVLLCEGYKTSPGSVMSHEVCFESEKMQSLQQTMSNFNEIKHYCKSVGEFSNFQFLIIWREREISVYSNRINKGIDIHI